MDVNLRRYLYTVGGKFQIEQVLTLQPLTAYSFSAWVLQMNTSNECTIRFTLDDQLVGEALISSSLTPSKEYKISGTYKSTSTTAKLGFITECIRDSTIWMDDFFLGETTTCPVMVEPVPVEPVPVPECPAGNAILNPGFELGAESWTWTGFVGRARQ